MLGFRFSYLYKLHTESFMGFNAVCLPGNPPGAFYRSSLPATPVSTPIRENGRFSEQALRERLCRTPSPRKCRLFESRVSEPDIGFNVLNSGLQLSSPDDDEIDEEAPRAFSPARPSLQSRLERLEQEKDLPANNLKRRLFVGGIPERVTKKELKEFFSKFGKITDCLIVQDHIKRRSRGYGFVIFSNAQEAEKAKNAPLEELEMYDRFLRVFPAEEKKSEKFKRDVREILFQQNADPDLTPTCEEETDSTSSLTITKSSSLQNINEMTDDMLLLIFSYLGIRDRIRLEFVCRKWRKLALELWRCQTNLNLQNVFCIWEGRPLTNRILLSLLKKCAGNLKRLDLSTASHTLDYKAVEIIAQCCPNLEHINLSSVKVTNVSLQQLAIKCPKLKHVILQRCFEVGEKGIWWLLHLCKKLECIDLTGNPRITGQCFHMAGPNLHTCALTKCSRFSPMGFTKLATRCRNLSALYLNDCFQLSDRALELLCQSLKNLKILYVGGIFPDLTASGLHHIGRLSSLENLSLAQNQQVDDDVVYAVSRGCKKLRFLDLSGCDEISDYSLTSLATCYSLRTLHISYLDRITDEGLSSIARHGSLETVLLRGCPNIGDQGLLTLVLLSPYLQHLDVSGCQHVTNVTVTACLDSVQARSSGKKLTLIAGGTSIELEALELDSNLLEVSRSNFCINSLRPDRLDYLGDDYVDEDDHFFENEDSATSESDKLASGDQSQPSASGDFNGEWSEIFESPL
ncbi:putative RNA-binding protein EEED8.10 [Argiope bruennichi]|uniref:Putative RNA-binding protein EEED8.10 like protein n=1 Tax=Argiope bruennichi TaxID=94029 RepID=A0A8T0E6V8_ARGBR|nr:putative RNA-binding protein EEED8.10 [Argiope bruennichi]XP_055937018.1 putative RNA-binding protein EEED8.10 [Argiope bruennichi]XP_055937019.1 putative RNA-binding protein EEED8.10 [Argiope bruennichi]KAF8767088.1 putative RNA-binding protein EEED8.10 like protein [Argiope bruennichi]